MTGRDEELEKVAVELGRWAATLSITISMLTIVMVVQIVVLAWVVTRLL